MPFLDLNQLYSDHQVAIVQAQRAPSVGLRQAHQTDAIGLAGQIGREQIKLGAAAACAWLASAMAHPA